MKKQFIVEIEFEPTDGQPLQNITDTVAQIFCSMLTAAKVQSILTDYKLFDVTQIVGVQELAIT